MYEINLSPRFRSAEGHFEEFTAMASALPSRQRTIELQLQAIIGHDTQARLAGLKTPTLVVHGTADRLLPYPNGELIASLVPAARLELLEDAGHMFWWERPERTAALLRQHALGA